LVNTDTNYYLMLSVIFFKQILEEITMRGTVVEMFLIIQLLIYAVIGVGWVKDIVKLSHCDFKPPYKAEVVYTVGIIPPVGMVTGWLDIGN